MYCCLGCLILNSLYILNIFLYNIEHLLNISCTIYIQYFCIMPALTIAPGKQSPALCFSQHSFSSQKNCHIKEITFCVPLNLSTTNENL